MQNIKDMQDIKVIALTGEIGAGKSTAAKILEAMGGVRLDADEIALSLWQRQDIKDKAVIRWGNKILDDNSKIIFAEVAKIIFNSSDEYKFCCNLIHPAVMSELEAQVKNLKALNKYNFIIVELPLLFEVDKSLWHDFWVDYILFIAADKASRVKRCAARGWDEDELKRRESYYLPAFARKAKSDFIINNNQDLNILIQELAGVLNKLNIKIKD
ncbi:MAG: dephospho-CoA kinase [Synergistaceae bacterium]|nr:dephospho-CoA kinase [Synergistaceae bacterium]MBR0096535.1 dephospho-CoA kinase [Synergistaceae bacterium]MBR0221300.1 dephospho-CoA kinase [Synergistaceae bacterium]